MRFHRDWSITQPWSQVRGISDLIAPEHLVVAKLEPATRRDLPGVLLDLRLESGDQVLSISCIYVDEQALFTKLRDLLIWPEAITRISTDRKLAALEAAVYPWIEYVLAGQGVDKEYEYIFSEGEAAVSYYEARSEGFFAAAPLSVTQQDVMLAQYAARFVAGAHMAASREALNAAMLIAPFARSTLFPDLDEKTRRIAQRWFGRALPRREDAGSSISLFLGCQQTSQVTLAEDARIISLDSEAGGTAVPYVPPLIIDDMFRLGEVRAESASLRVIAHERPYVQRIADPPRLGGASGNIMILLRRDAREIPGSDVDEAEALRCCLAAEGFLVEICTEYTSERMQHVGLIHAIGIFDPEPIDQALQYAKANGLPMVVSPLFEDGAQEGRWGMRASRSLLGSFDDEMELERTLQKLAERRVEIDGITAQTRVDDGYDRLRREILRRAEVVIVNSRAEHDAVQRFSGRRRRILQMAPVIHAYAKNEAVGHIIPDTPYVLVHAAVDARHNVGLVMRALRVLELPTVMIVPYVDRRLARMLQAMSAIGCVLLPQVTLGECEAIYSRAAVYVDAAWIGDGVFRIMQAAVRGIELALSQSRSIPQEIERHVSRIDPASVRSIQTGIADAWQRALSQEHLARIVERESWQDPAQMLRACIQAYVQAGEHVENTHKDSSRLLQAL